MGFTNKTYPEMEIAVFVKNKPDHRTDTGTAKVGDIIAVRNPHHVIGMKERTNYIWLRIEGLEEYDINGLSQTNDELELSDPNRGMNPHYDKRRFCIPLERLKEIYPAFDIDRAKDTTDEYQPFMLLDEETGEYLAPKNPFNVTGLIFDKYKMRYL